MEPIIIDREERGGNCSVDGGISKREKENLIIKQVSKKV